MTASTDPRGPGVTALVRGLALGVTPDGPEAETYLAGQLAVWHGPDGPVDVVTLGQDGPWVDIVPEHGSVGWTVSERELSPRAEVVSPEGTS